MSPVTTVGGGLEGFRERLERAASRYRYAPVLRDEGRVRRVGDGVAHVSGLGGVRLDERVEVEGGVDGLAFDLEPSEVGVVLLGSDADVAVGARVRSTGAVVSVPVGDGLLGRVVDPLGRPLDEGGPVRGDAHWPSERPAPEIHERAPVEEPLLSGLTVVDALFPIGRGQRELIIGDRGTGKSTIALDAVLNQRDTGVRCVYVSIGQKASSVLSLLERLRGSDAMAHTTVVVAPAEAPPGLRWLAPYSGCSIAEWFRDRGEDALLVLDDLTRHAVAYRELSLVLRRPAGREAYPGDIFFIHSRLLERATHLGRERGGGSLTALPIAETQAGRIADFIPTNLISITDGQLYLDSGLFDKGYRPAVDVGRSVSRVGGKTQRPAMKAVAGRMRLTAARYREVEVFTRFGSRLEEETRRLLLRGERLAEVLKQPPGHPVDHGRQVARLIALEEGLLDRLPLREVPRALSVLDRELAKRHPAALRALERGLRVDEDERVAVRDALEEVDRG